MSETNGGIMGNELNGSTMGETEQPKAGETVTTPESEQLTLVSDAVSVDTAPEGADMGESAVECKEEPKPKPRGVNVSMKETIADLTRELTEEVKAHERTKMTLKTLENNANMFSYAFNKLAKEKNEEILFYRYTLGALLIAVVALALLKGG